MNGLGIIIGMAVSCFALGMWLRELLYEFEGRPRKSKHERHKQKKKEDEEDR